MANKRYLLNVLDELTSMVNSWNDAQADGDRGRGNNLLCLVIGDDGSGAIGTVHKVPDEMNEFLSAKNAEEMAEWICEWGEEPFERKIDAYRQVLDFSVECPHCNKPMILITSHDPGLPTFHFCTCRTVINIVQDGVGEVPSFARMTSEPKP